MILHKIHVKNHIFHVLVRLLHVSKFDNKKNNKTVVGDIYLVLCTTLTI